MIKEGNLLDKLVNGIANLNDVQALIKIHKNKYQLNKKESVFIELACYEELLRRLKTSVFNDNNITDVPVGIKKCCVSIEFYNTLLFIELITNIMKIADKYGDITQSTLYRQPDPGYRISRKTIIHIILRHNKYINSFAYSDSKKDSYPPSSFSFGAIAEPMYLLLMTLNTLTIDDWKKTNDGKKFIAHVEIARVKYSIVADFYKNIKSFYPRSDGLDVDFIKLERCLDKMVLLKCNS